MFRVPKSDALPCPAAASRSAASMSSTARSVTDVEPPRGRHRFHPPGPDLRGEFRLRTTSCRNAAFLLRDSATVTADVRSQQLDRQPGKARARTEVQQGLAGAELRAGEQALAEVPADDLLRRANRGEVDPRIPLDDKFKINNKLRVN